MLTTALLSWLALPVALVSAAPYTVPTEITLSNFTRDCSKPDSCSYNFIIDYKLGTQNCSTVDTVKPTDVGADVHPWYNVGCAENPSTWQISWGWDYKGDFAVVTVKNAPNQYEAFFGYSHPNAGGPIFKYADETNKVQPVSK